MRFPPLPLCAVIAITVSAAFINGGAAYAAGSGSNFSMSQPQGFDALSAEREVVLDAYFGGRKLGEVRARISPGSIRFHDPQSLAGLIPDVSRPDELAGRLAGPLPSNGALACGPARGQDCGMLDPGETGVIVDEERFRVDIFVSPSLLIKPDPSTAQYLAKPDQHPSLISLFGATASGSSRGGDTLHFQNRSIASLGALRVRSDSSISTDTGLSFDNLTLERDHGDWRYAGGLFWAPGSELIGRRKIAGFGVMTQLDTRENREALLGTPVSVFLQQPGKIDLLVDGRIVSSRIYPAGNRLIDTAALPNGSYDLIVRIQEDGRPPRQEQRFFSKGSAMAPAGRPLFSAFAGLLPASGRGLSMDGGTFFYEATAAYRLSPALGVDAAVLGTPRKTILEGGLVYHSARAQVRLAGLISSSADIGAVLRISSVGQSPLSFSFDLRKVVSQDGRPLLPLTVSRGTFSEEPQSGFTDRGSYSQALSILGYRFGQANLRLTGLYRRNGSRKANYSLGAAVDLPVVRTGRWDIVLQADARRTERDFASFIGARFLMNRNSFALSGSGGANYQSNRPGRNSQLVGEVQAGWFRALAAHSQFAGDVAAGRDADGAYARASAYARSPLVNARADLLQQFGDHRTTQYAATLDGGLVLAKSGLGIAGRDMNDSALMIRVGGGEAGQKFDVLVDEVARGTVTADERLVLFLQPYHQYDVHLRPRGAQLASFDTAPRSVTLYPGNVSKLDWKVAPLFILFGRAVGTDGQGLADADIVGPHGIGRTDGEGYFQIETNSGEQLQLKRGDGATCVLTVPQATPVHGLVSAGDVICR
ncbi:MAG TPA: CS1-pili formation C-terminal domain-containing protein [Sphingomicrobium sp.]